MKNFLILFMFGFLLVGCPDKKDSPSEPPDISQPAPTPTPTDPPTSPPTGPGGEPPISEPPDTTNPSPDPTPEPGPEIPPDPADTFEVNITFGGDSKYNTAARRAKYIEAIKMMKKIVATQEFKDRILAHKYNGVSGFASSSASPNTVYQHILDGNEKRKPTKDNEMDMEVRFYYSSGNVVGYTYPNVDYIYVNVKYFDTYAYSSVCANMMHEWLHKLGYGHDSARTARRPYSVPYAVGGIVRSIGREM